MMQIKVLSTYLYTNFCTYLSIILNNDSFIEWDIKVTLKIPWSEMKLVTVISFSNIFYVNWMVFVMHIN